MVMVTEGEGPDQPGGQHAHQVKSRRICRIIDAIQLQRGGDSTPPKLITLRGESAGAVFVVWSNDAETLQCPIDVSLRIH
jgi:hypothetical protein